MEGKSESDERVALWSAQKNLRIASSEKNPTEHRPLYNNAHFVRYSWTNLIGLYFPLCACFLSILTLPVPFPFGVLVIRIRIYLVSWMAKDESTHFFFSSPLWMKCGCTLLSVHIVYNGRLCFFAFLCAPASPCKKEGWGLLTGEVRSMRMNGKKNLRYVRTWSFFCYAVRSAAFQQFNWCFPFFFLFTVDSLRVRKHIHLAEKSKFIDDMRLCCAKAYQEFILFNFN